MGVSFSNIARAIAYSQAARIAAEATRQAEEEATAAAKAKALAEARLRAESHLSEKHDRIAFEKWLARRQRTEADPDEVASANAFVSRMAVSLTEARAKEDALSEMDMAELARLEADRRAKAEELRLAVAGESRRRQAALAKASRPNPERDERLEQERLDFMAAQLVRRTT